MKRIKDIKKIKLANGVVLAEVKKGKSKIIITNEHKVGESDYYAQVILVTEGVSRVAMGDVILKAQLQKANSFEWNKKDYMIIPEHAIDIAVTPENFKLDA